MILMVAAPMLYHPACGNGGGVLCFELLRRLAFDNEVHFLAFGRPGAGEETAMQALREVVRSVTVVPTPKTKLPRFLSGWTSTLVQLLSGLPREVRDLRSVEFRHALQALAARTKADAVMLQFPHLAQYVDAVPGVPCVIDVQDAAGVSRFREWRSASSNLLRKTLRGHAWWCWARYELRHYKRASSLMLLSESDHGVMRAFLPQVPAFLSPVAWTVPPLSAATRDSRCVLFMGNFSHAPNLDGLHWLLNDIWPLVRRQCPQAVLHVAGKNLPAGFVSDVDSGVIDLGFVPEVAPLLHRAAISLVPYRFGGGIKIKAIESMAHGCAVVATRVGSEGLQAQDGVHLLEADGAGHFAAAIVELLGKPERRAAIALAGRELVAERFSWDSKLEALLREIRALRWQVGQTGRQAA